MTTKMRLSAMYPSAPTPAPATFATVAEYRLTVPGVDAAMRESLERAAEWDRDALRLLPAEPLFAEPNYPGGYVLALVRRNGAGRTPTTMPDDYQILILTPAAGANASTAEYMVAMGYVDRDAALRGLMGLTIVAQQRPLADPALRLLGFRRVTPKPAPTPAQGKRTRIVKG
jgi:hypothetical protein